MLIHIFIQFFFVFKYININVNLIINNMINKQKLTLIWNTERPFINATNLDNVVFPAPETPINNK